MIIRNKKTYSLFSKEDIDQLKELHLIPLQSIRIPLNNTNNNDYYISLLRSSFYKNTIPRI